MTERDQRVARSRTFKNLRVIFALDGKAVMDIGCGNGEYLRHFGHGSFGITTTPEEVENGKSKNLDIRLANAEDFSSFAYKQKIEVIWANNLLEHLLSPHAFLAKLRKKMPEESVAILGVPVVPFPSFLLHLPYFRGALASNHISFFTRKTLALTARYAGWKVLTIRPFFFRNKWLDTLVSPFTPHQYLVVRPDLNFTYPAKKVREWVSDTRYDELLALTGQKHA